MAVNEKKVRQSSTLNEASNYTCSWDYAAHPGSSPGRPSRPSKKVHNFGKRSNSIRRNPCAPVIKRNWLYKQDSTGMKLWKKRWFVLSDMCLFYYRDEKEEGLLGSILLPSFHVSMLSVDDHVNRKYAFKVPFSDQATHPNMRTYYFCTDTTKEMESWMKVMTDAALVHAEPVKRLDKLESEQCAPQDHVTNHHMQQLRETENKITEATDKCISPIPPTTTEEERKQDTNHCGFRKEGSEQDCSLTNINNFKLQAKLMKTDVTPLMASNEKDSPQVNGSLVHSTNETCGPPQQSPAQEVDRNLSRTSSMHQLEQWVRTQRGRSQEEDMRSVSSYQTLPRNMSSHWFPVIPQYEDGYRSMPRNSMGQRGSICSLTPSLYEHALGPSMAEKRRSMRDDTLWQLYEWQQRQAYNRQPWHYSRMASPKTIINLSEHAPMSYSIPPSPSHGSLSMYSAYSPIRSYNMGSTRSDVPSPIYRQDMSIDRRLRPPINKYAYPPDRRSMPAGIPFQTISAQPLQSKTPEELTLLLIKLRRQQAELNSIREHTIAQLMQLNFNGDNPKNDILSNHLQRNLINLDNQMNPEDYTVRSYSYLLEDVDIDIKLSRLCEQDKLVKIQNDKVQQLYREKHTLETALLSASQEIEMGSDNPAILQSVIQQRDLLQSGLLSTCRELSKVTTELEQALMEYDRIEGEVRLIKNSLLEQMESLGSPQTEPPSQQHVRIQKDLWQIQDVMEALNKHKAQIKSANYQGFHSPKEEDSVPPRPPLPQSYQPDNPSVPPLPGTRHSSLYRPEDRMTNHRNCTHSGPDYRLYKSEPELTTVTEVDESNGEERHDHPPDREHTANKGMPFRIGIVPPRTKSPVRESSSMASCVTLRNSKKADPKVDRPHSAVEQLCFVESSRPRMSVEEQLDRIRRHQQGALKGKKKGMISRNGNQNNTPSRSHSFTKENPLPNMQFQMRRREEMMSSEIREIETSLQQQGGAREIESPSEEIARLKDLTHASQFNVDRELSVPDKVLIPERYIESDPEEALSPEQEADKQKKVDRIKALIARNSMQNMVPSKALSPEEEAEGEVMVQEKEKMINISYELAAEASKRSKLVAAQALASVKSYM